MQERQRFVYVSKERPNNCLDPMNSLKICTKIRKQRLAKQNSKSKYPLVSRKYLVDTVSKQYLLGQPNFSLVRKMAFFGEAHLGAGKF